MYVCDIYQISKDVLIGYMCDIPKIFQKKISVGYVWDISYQKCFKRIFQLVTCVSYTKISSQKFFPVGYVCDIYHFLYTFVTYTKNFYQRCFNWLQAQYGRWTRWTLGPLSSATRRPIFMHFTGCHQPVQY